MRLLELQGGPVISTVDLRYRAKAYGWAPITWTRRVALGTDPYWQQYFWSRWGRLPESLAPCGDQPSLWIDAQSLGEVNQLKSLLRLIKIRRPTLKTFVSTNEPSSFEASRRLPVDGVFDNPWDLPGPIRRTLSRLRPRALVVVEHPKNPIRLKVARELGIKTLLISGTFPAGWEKMPMMRRTLELGGLTALDGAAVKSEEDAEQYQRWGVPEDRIRVVGDLKFDRGFILEKAKQADPLGREFGIGPGDRCWVAGSVHLGEEEFLMNAWAAARKEIPSLRLILVPRWAEQGKVIARNLRRKGASVLLRSQATGNLPWDPGSVLVVDRYGELIAWYALSWAVFLGGSALTRSGDWQGLCHNPIEPLSLGKPTFFGPNHHLRDQICQWLRGTWQGLSVLSPDELARRLVELHTASDLRQRIREEALKVTGQADGVVERYADWLIDEVKIGA